MALRSSLSGRSVNFDDDPTTYAVKIYKKEKLTMKDLDRVRSEKLLMERFSGSTSIIQIVDYFEDKSFLCFVMDYYRYDVKTVKREILDNLGAKEA